MRTFTMTLLLLQWLCLGAGIAIRFSDRHASLMVLESLMYLWAIAFCGCWAFSMYSDDPAERKKKGA